MVTAIGTVIFLTALCYTLLPLMEKKEAWILPEDAIAAHRESLVRDKAIYLKALQDINFEHASSKINTDDYNELKSHYRQKASIIIEAIEELDKQTREPENSNG